MYNLKDLQQAIGTYGNNEVIHVYITKGEVWYKVYSNMTSFLIFGTTNINYNDTLECHVAKTTTNSNIHRVYRLCSLEDFMKGAKRYKARYHHNCYKALYAEVIMSKHFNGKHNRVNTEHSKGDFTANGKRYEVKFGREVTL